MLFLERDLGRTREKKRQKAQHFSSGHNISQRFIFPWTKWITYCLLMKMEVCMYIGRTVLFNLSFDIQCLTITLDWISFRFSRCRIESDLDCRLLAYFTGTSPALKIVSWITVYFLFHTDILVQYGIPMTTVSNHSGLCCCTGATSNLSLL